MARHLFSKVISGEVEIVIGQEFALDNVKRAHDALEGRTTTGSTILTV